MNENVFIPFVLEDNDQFCIVLAHIVYIVGTFG